MLSIGESSTIYCTVPIDFERMEEEKKGLLNFLRDNKGKFFSARTLALECGYKTTNTQAELRKAITELICQNHAPIVSNAKGFAWATHPNMIEKYIEDLTYREQGLIRRMNALRTIKAGMKEEK